MNSDLARHLELPGLWRRLLFIWTGLLSVLLWNEWSRPTLRVQRVELRVDGGLRAELYTRSGEMHDGVAVRLLGLDGAERLSMLEFTDGAHEMRLAGAGTARLEPGSLSLGGDGGAARVWFGPRVPQTGPEVDVRSDTGARISIQMTEVGLSFEKEAPPQAPTFGNGNQ